MQIKISRFQAVNNKKAIAREALDWASFCAMFTPDKVVRIPVAKLEWDVKKGKWKKPNKGLEMFSPAHFRDDYANAPNHEASSAIGLDYDAVLDETIDQVVARVRSLECAAIVHTTFNYTEAHQAFRVLFSASRDVTFEENTRIVKGLCELFEGKASSNICDASRFWFGPGTPEGGEYHVRFLEGEPLDVDVFLACLPPEVAKPPAALPSTIDESHPDYAERLEWFVKHCRTCTPPTNGGETFTIASRGTRSAELPAEIVLKVLRDEVWPRCANPVAEEDWHKVEKLVNRTITASDGTFVPGTVAEEIDGKRFFDKFLSRDRASQPSASEVRMTEHANDTTPASFPVDCLPAVATDAGGYQFHRNHRRPGAHRWCGGRIPATTDCARRAGVASSA